MNNYWKNQVVLITGASRGIGKEMAIHFSQLGAKVAINYSRSEQEAFATFDKCQKETTLVVRCDVSNKEEVETMFDNIEEKLGAVTVLVNNAGITKDGLMLSMSDEDWLDVIDINLTGAFYTSRRAAKNMLLNKHGRIINISSVSGIKGTAGQTNYSAAKAGLIGLTKAMARELGKKKITCNAVAFGAFKTEMVAQLDEATQKVYAKTTSLKRLGEVDETLGIVEYLASDKATYVTGQTMVIDGGMV